jgi:excisionase family DNA binding protein
MAPTEILNLRQAATRLGVSDRDVLDLLSAGTLKGQKVGTQWRFQAQDIDAYLDQQAAQKASPSNSE